jgi:hypothetical protein
VSTYYRRTFRYHYNPFSGVVVGRVWVFIAIAVRTLYPTPTRFWVVTRVWTSRLISNRRFCFDIRSGYATVTFFFYNRAQMRSTFMAMKLKGLRSKAYNEASLRLQIAALGIQNDVCLCNRQKVETFTRSIMKLYWRILLCCVFQFNIMTELHNIADEVRVLKLDSLYSTNWIQRARELTIRTERLPLVGEVSASFWG